MTSITALWRREAIGLLRAEATYVGCTVLAIAALTIAAVQGLFNNGRADVAIVLDAAAALMVAFAPGVACVVWRDWRDQGSRDARLDGPDAIWTLATAKYFAALMVIGGAVVTLTPAWAALNMMGAPDNGAIAVGFFGLLLTGAALLAVAFAAPVLVQSRFAAYGLGVCICLAFTVFGWAPVQAALKPFLGSGLVETLAGFSWPTRAEAFQYGVIDAAALAYFGSLAVLGLILTALAGGAQQEG